MLAQGLGHGLIDVRDLNLVVLQRIDVSPAGRQILWLEIGHIIGFVDSSK